MKLSFIVFFILLALNSFAQEWKTSYNLLFTNQSTKIGIGTNQLENEKMLLNGDTLLNIGGKIGIRTVMGCEGEYFHGYIDGRVGTAGNWSSQGQGSASSGTLYLSKTSANGLNSSTGAGFFHLKLQDYSNSGGYTNYAAGSLSLLTGNIASVTNRTVIGAVVGVDRIKADSTWAAYFDGKGYFSGKVGIGTKATESALTVKGKIECEEIEVKNIGADYVFEKDYQLMPLSDLEAYINKNGHLPEIAPSIETEKGVNLSEFSEQLLRKVEELTLYMIDLNKENEMLKGEIKALSQK